MKRIIVGFDGSDEARDALRLGDRLARIEGCELVVVAAGLFEPQISTEAERKMAKESLQGLFARVGETLGGTRRYVPKTVVGLPVARGLISAAEEDGADLIVVGSTHRGRLGQVLPGSVGTQLLRGAPCPVVITPRGFAGSGRDVRGVIGVAYDGSPESELALEEAFHLARVLEVGLRLITVVPEQEIASTLRRAPTDYRDRRANAGEQLSRALATVPGDLEADVLLVDGDPGCELLDCCAELDLLVMGSRGRGPLRRTMLGGVSTHLCASAECPVVVVPRGAETGAEALAATGAES